MTKNHLYYIIGSAVVIFLVIIFLNFYHPPKENDNSVDRSASVESFTECRDAGYPTTLSYPKQCRTPEGIIFVEDLSPSTPTSPSGSVSPGSGITYKDLIKVSNPKSGGSINIRKPFKVKGEARGNWYFEASFPVKVTDPYGNVLVEKPVQAIGDWMTTDYVPFSTDIPAIFPATTVEYDSGFIVFEKDNPSGLPEHADSFKIPVRFVR